MDTLWPLLLLVLFANLVEAIAGFGSTVLSLTIGAQLFSISDLLAMLVPLNLLLSAGILINGHRDIAWRTFFTRILPFAGAGLPIGVLLFRTISGRGIQLAFGIVVVLLGAEGLARLLRRRDASSIPQADRSVPVTEPPVTRTDRIGVLFLFFGGIMQGMYASGGPFIVYFASRAIPEKRAFRATLSLLWLVMNLVLLMTLVQSGQVNTYTLQFTLYLIPAVLLGLFAGSRIHEHVSERTFQIGVYALLMIAGTALLLR